MSTSTTTPTLTPAERELLARWTVPGFCTRCDRLSTLILGMGVDSLCGRCRVHERSDRDAAPWRTRR